MKSPRPNDDQSAESGRDAFARLASRYLDDDASDEELAQLQREMAGDPDKRRLFVRLNLQFALLHEAMQGAYGVLVDEQWPDEGSLPLNDAPLGLPFVSESTSDAVPTVDSPAFDFLEDNAESADNQWGSGFRVQGPETVVSDQWSVVSDESSVRRSPSPLPPVIIHTLASPLSPFPSFIGGVLFSYLTAAVILNVALAIAWAWKLPENTQIAAQPASLPSPLSPLPSVVGRITGMVDCRWEEEGLGIRDWGLDESGENHGAVRTRLQSLIPNPQSLVRLGDRFALASGLMEITYDAGATVILQGPVTYEVESNNGGYLSVGKLTARLGERGEGRGERKKWRVESGERRAQGGKQTAESDALTTNHYPLSTSSNPQSRIPNPLFAVRTPTALVTDLGTEFGVEVDKQGATTSHVFRGLVRVRMLGAGGRVEGEEQTLRENEAIRVDRSGQRRLVVVPAAKSPGFVREIPALTIKMLDLVDVVAGGDGFSGRRNRGIDPTTGRTADAQPVPGTLTGNHKYHRVESLPFVDGVFVPEGSQGPVQVDSAGHSFEFDPTDNLSGGHIWAAGRISFVDFARCGFPRTKLGQIEYDSPGHGAIFMHANKGITFDLQAIRRANPGQTLARFHAVAGNTETYSQESPGVYADLWVLVDGQVRFRRTGIAGGSGAFSILFPIAEKDRFLTLAATDGGNGVSYDWIIFGDPRLELIDGINSNSTTPGMVKH